MYNGLNPESDLRNEDIYIFCEREIQYFKRRANFYKRESLIYFIVIIISSLVAPLFIAFGGSNLFWSKIMPSVLSIIAAGVTSWLQIRKPQQLWAMYRTTQRELEDCQTRYKYKIGEFNVNPEKILAEKAANILLNTYHNSIRKIPNPEELTVLGTQMNKSNESKVHQVSP